MPFILDSTTGLTVSPPIAVAQGGNGNTTGNVTSSQVAGALNATGSAPLFACRAWVNFNGTGVVAIRASGNVSSITDNGVGNYTVNFATAMQDASYAVSGTADRTSGSRQCFVSVGNGVGAIQTGSVGINTLNDSTTLADAEYVGASIFR